MKSSLTARRVQPWKIEPRQEPRSREERVDLVDIAVQELAIRRTRPRRQEPARPWASNAVPSTTPTSGTLFVHTVIDDQSRGANAEIHDNETTDTAIGVLRRAVGWFGARGVSVARVLCDNGFCYRSHAWRDACAELQIQYKRTRPYRPRTNGKI